MGLHTVAGFILTSPSHPLPTVPSQLLTIRRPACTGALAKLPVASALAATSRNAGLLRARW